MFMQNQWLRLSIILLIALLVRIALGAPATSLHRPAPVLTEEIPSSRGTTALVSVGPGLAMMNGQTAAAGNVQAELRWDPALPIFVGVDGAVTGWGQGLAGNAGPSAGYQLLPTAIYRFEWAQFPMLHPYLGASIGPYLLVARSPRGENLSTVYFEALARPGVQVDISDEFGLGIEPKFGLLGSSFVFLPQLQMSLSL